METADNLLIPLICMYFLNNNTEIKLLILDLLHIYQ